MAQEVAAHQVASTERARLEGEVRGLRQTADEREAATSTAMREQKEQYASLQSELTR